MSVCVEAEVTAVMELFPSELCRLSGRLGGDLDFLATCILDSLSLVLVATSLIRVAFVLVDGVSIEPFRSQPVIENCSKVLDDSLAINSIIELA